MNVARNSVKNGLALAALVVICWAQVSLAGYTSALSTSGVGEVSSSLNYFGTANQAVTPNNYNQPSAGVDTTVGKWTTQTNPPLGTPTVVTSTVATVFLTGGYKALARSYVTKGITADNSDLSQKLAKDGYVLTPNMCGAGYTVASGDETINNQRFLVVLGNGTGGTATWFRGYIFNNNNGVPASRDDLIQNGTQLYDVVVQGPFDFGDINSTDRCDALKIPIAYTGPNLYLVSDGLAVSTTDLQFVGCPSSTYNLASCNPVYPTLMTIGGCGAATITFNPASASSFAPGTGGNVTATATDAAGNTATCQFTVFRPALQFANCPTTPFLMGCNGSVNPGLQTSGGCAPVTITYNPALNALVPGTNNVTATATDAKGNVAMCPFTVIRPFLTLGASGFASPIGGTGGSCAAPVRQIKGGGTTLQIKFSTFLCNTIYTSTTAPTITITQLDPSTCGVTQTIVNQQQLALTSNTWHWQWQTAPSNVGYFEISVNLGDGNPNPPYAIVQLQ